MKHCIQTLLTLTLALLFIGLSALAPVPLMAADLAPNPTSTFAADLTAADLTTEPTFDATHHSTQGAQIFQVHCIGCHLNGGNIVRRGKTLKLKALQRNGVDSVASIAQLVTNGKGNMSAYRDRLSEAEIQTVAAYVLEQAQKNWK